MVVSSDSQADDANDAALKDSRGLKANALSFFSNLAIGLASTAPAYSLASALGMMVGAVAFVVPGILIAAFIPVLFIAIAYFHLNRADPDCGTSFSWVTRAMGPYWGWMAGWAIVATDILVMPGLAQVGALYSFRILGVDHPDLTAQVLVGVSWIAIMTAVCYYGIGLSALLQKFLLTAEIIVLVVFAVVALAKVYGAAPPSGAQHVQWNWFNPFAVHDPGVFASAMLIAVFIYWGWDCGASVNQETKNPKITPARAAVTSTFVLVGLYVLVAAAAMAFAEPRLAKPSGDDFLAPLARDVLPNWLADLLILAVVTSAVASTLTTILPTARTVLSMADAGAVPKRFGEIHQTYKTPGFATLVMGVFSIVWYVFLSYVASADVLSDSVLATAFGIAFYYALTGFACAIYYRRELRKDSRKLVFIGIVPTLGALMMVVLFVVAFESYLKSGQGGSQTSIFGVGSAVVFGIGALLCGVVLMIFARICLPAFFMRKLEIVDPEKLRR